MTKKSIRFFNDHEVRAVWDDENNMVPDAIMEIRYYSTYNFVGARIDGYEQPIALMTRHAADSLKVVSDELRREWWHFTLIDEPYPDTYFTFLVKK